jgi:hypothetical protein
VDFRPSLLPPIHSPILGPSIDAIPHLPFEISISIAGLINNDLLSIRQAHLRCALHTHWYNVVDPSRNQETGDSPDPNNDSKRYGDEERWDEDEERDANPEEGEEECGYKGERKGAQDE